MESLIPNLIVSSFVQIPAVTAWVTQCNGNASSQSWSGEKQQGKKRGEKKYRTKKKGADESDGIYQRSQPSQKK